MPSAYSKLNIKTKPALSKSILYSSSNNQHLKNVQLQLTFKLAQYFKKCPINFATHR